jgi:hypothetical protein
MKNKLFTILGTLVMVAAFFVSCATSLPITVNHPPLMDTNGIERLVVLPFEGSGNRGQIASTLTSMFREKISGTNTFQLVEPVTYRPNAGLADAIFTGTITNYTVEDGERTVKRRDMLVPVYDRKVSLEFTYRIVRDRDGTIIGERRISGSRTITEDDPANLQAGESLAKAIAEGELRDFNREIVPWTSQEKLTLDKETSKDKAVKDRMKEAESLVKAGNLKPAQDAYATIYEETGSLAAGYNHAIVTQALDGLDAAISAMSALVSATGYTKARTELTRLQGFRGENTAAAANLTGTSAQDVAIKNAADALIARLPAGSRVSLLNISTSERDRVDVVIREVTAALLKTGNITVLDRDNLQVIEAEKQYQASGDVSDDSYVSIGHMLGVETIVTFSISGSGSQRKLAIKTVSVETGAVLDNTLTEI